MKKLKIIFLFLLFSTTYNSFAQDSNKLVVLSKQIIEAKSAAELSASFEELKSLYFKEDKYSQLTDFLKSLSEQKKGLEA